MTGYKHGGWLGDVLLIGVALVGALILISPAFAEVPVLLPPRKYDHAPLRPVPEVFLPWDEVDAYCRARGVQWQSRESGGRILECAVKADGWYACVLMQDLEPGYLDQWRRHCIGHVNGWPVDHPDAHYEDVSS